MSMFEQVRDVGALIAAMAGGERPELVFFWGHRPSTCGGPGREVLSQWWKVRFEVDGVGYSSAEHWMMAEKARLFGDEAMRAEIIAAPDPAAAKRLGRKVRGFDHAVWEARCVEIVTEGNVAKFGQNPELGAFLASTGSGVLVEASPQDRIWGIGMVASDPRASDPTRWDGRNLLGFALMEARHRLAAAGSGQDG